MKYFKFTQIDASTGISWAIAQPISGPSMPNLPGLTSVVNLAHNRIYYVAKVDDSAQEDPSNHFFEITFEEYAKELKDHVNHIINERKSKIYIEEKEFRQGVFSNYDVTAIAAGIYKYDEAKMFLADNSAIASSLRSEATFRGITTQSLAEKIVANHESFKEKDSKIAGIRGKILDRLNNFVFNLSDPEASLSEFKDTETIGTTKEKVLENGILVEKDIEVKIEKMSFNISTRFLF